MSQDLLAPGRIRIGLNLQDNVDVVERTVAESATRGEKYFELYEASAVGAKMSLAKARGTGAAPGNVTQDDSLGSYYFRAYSGGFFATGSVDAEVDAAVVGGQRPASRVIFKTNANNAAPRLVGYFSNEGYLGLGTAMSPSTAATRAAAPLHVAGSGAGADLKVRFDAYEAAAANSAVLNFARARGTFAVPTNVAQDDTLARIIAGAYSNSLLDTAEIRFSVDAAVVAGQRPASRVSFFTNANNAAARRVGYMSSEGYLGWGTAFDPSVVATRAAYPVHVVASASGAELFHTIENYDAANNATYRMGRARGTFAAPTTVVTGDILGELEFFSYTNQWHHCAEITSSVEGTVVAGTVPDSNLQFTTTVGGALNICGTYFSTGVLGLGAGATQSLTTVNNNSVGKLWIAMNDATAPVGFQRASNDTGSASLYFRKSRGTLAAPATVANNDEMSYTQYGAYTNAWHDNLAAIATYIDAAVVAGQRPASRIAFRTQTNNQGGPTDRMVIYSGGTVFIGNGTADTTRPFHVSNSTTTFAIARIQSTGGGATNHVLRLDGGDNSTTGSKFVAFNRPDGTEVGNVTQNAAGTVQYNTSSDARLKENIRNLGPSEGLDLVRALVPRAFNFIGDMAHPMRGFVAQEIYAVLPEVVSVGGGDACACDLSEGKSHVETCFKQSPWSVDYGKLTPVIVKAIQELAARVSALDGK